MSEMFVDVESLSFRSAPVVSTDTLIGKVYLTQKIEVIKEEPPGWAKCTASGSNKTGYVSRKYLRQPLTPNHEALIASVNREYFRFERGMGKEHVSPYSSYVGEMWKALKISNLDGTNKDVPWSAKRFHSGFAKQERRTRTSSSSPHIPSVFIKRSMLA